MADTAENNLPKRKAEARYRRSKLQGLYNQFKDNPRAMELLKQRRDAFNSDYADVIPLIEQEDQDEKFRAGQQLGEEQEAMKEKMADVPYGEYTKKAVRGALHGITPFGLSKKVDEEGYNEYQTMKEEMPLGFRIPLEVAESVPEAMILGSGVRKLAPYLSKFPFLGPGKKSVEAAEVVGNALPISRKSVFLLEAGLDAASEGLRASLEGANAGSAAAITAGASGIMNIVGNLANILPKKEVYKILGIRDEADFAQFYRRFDRSMNDLAELEDTTRQRYEIPHMRKSTGHTQEDLNEKIAQKVQEKGEIALDRFHSRAFSKQDMEAFESNLGKVAEPIIFKQGNKVVEMTPSQYFRLEEEKLYKELLPDYDEAFRSVKGVQDQIDALTGELEKANKEALDYYRVANSRQGKKDLFNKMREAGIEKKGKIPTPEELENWHVQKLNESANNVNSIVDKRDALVKQKNEALLKSPYAQKLSKDEKEILGVINLHLNSLESMEKGMDSDITVGSIKQFADLLNNTFDNLKDPLKGKGTKLYDFKNKLRNYMYGQITGSDIKSALMSRYTQGREFITGLGKAEGKKSDWISQRISNAYVDNDKVMEEISDPKAIEKYTHLISKLKNEGFHGSDLINEFNMRLNKLTAPKSKALAPSEGLWFDGDAMDLYHLNKDTQEMAKNYLTYMNTGGLENRLMVGGLAGGLTAAATAGTYGATGSGQSAAWVGAVGSLLTAAGMSSYKSIMGAIARKPNLVRLFQNPESVSLANKILQHQSTGTKSKVLGKLKKMLRGQIVEDIEREGFKIDTLMRMSRDKARKKLVDSPTHFGNLLRWVGRQTVRGTGRQMKVAPSRYNLTPWSSEESEEGY